MNKLKKADTIACQARRLCKQQYGKTLEVIAREEGVKPAAIINRLRRTGNAYASTPKNVAITGVVQRRIRKEELYNKFGFTAPQLAEQLGVDETTIYQRYKTYGTPYIQKGTAGRKMASVPTTPSVPKTPAPKANPLKADFYTKNNISLKDMFGETVEEIALREGLSDNAIRKRYHKTGSPYAHNQIGITDHRINTLFAQAERLLDIIDALNEIKVVQQSKLSK